MTDRKTLKVQPNTKDRFDELKRDGETTDGLLARAFDALEADEDRDQWPGAPRCSDCGAIAHAWTVEGGSLLCPQCAEGEVDPDSLAAIPDVADRWNVKPEEAEAFLEEAGYYPR